MSTFTDLLGEVNRLRAEEDPVLLAIDGLGGAGKSSLAAKVSDRLDCSQIIGMDEFYLAGAEPGTGEPSIFFDRTRLITQVLEPLREGIECRYQLYDWELGRLGEWKRCPAEGLIIVEGVSSLHPRLLDFYDISVWVDAPEALRLERAEERDGEKRLAEWRERWMPEEARYAERYEPWTEADFVIPGWSGD